MDDDLAGPSYVGDLDRVLRVWPTREFWLSLHGHDWLPLRVSLRERMLARHRRMMHWLMFCAALALLPAALMAFEYDAPWAALGWTLGVAAMSYHRLQKMDDTRAERLLGWLGPLEGSPDLRARARALMLTHPEVMAYSDRISKLDRNLLVGDLVQMSAIAGAREGLDSLFEDEPSPPPAAA